MSGIMINKGFVNSFAFMKIIFIGGRDIHKLGGIENYMYNLATQLVKLGHTPIVYCESDRNETEYVNGFKVIHQKSWGGRFFCKILLSYKATVKSLSREKDVCVFHYNAWGPGLASWLPSLMGKITILQGHGFEWKRTKYTPFQQKVMKMMEWVGAKTHSHLVMVSQEQTDFYLKEYRKKCVTIPTAVNIPEIDSLKSDILERYGLEEEGYFLFLGRLVQDKNPDYLIKAYLRSEIRNKKLVIAGENTSDRKFVHYLHELTEENSNIIFTGAVYKDDKEFLLKNCFAFCIPSTIEGLPITLLEAMSYKRICLASEIPACREALGNYGVWVTPEREDELAEKLLFIVNNGDELKRKEIGVYQRILDEFTWGKVSFKYIQYLKTLVSH